MSLDNDLDNKIIVATTRFGDLEVDAERVIDFPDGIIGFPNLKRYVLIDHKDTSLKWLHSIDDPDIAFIVASPEFIAPDFSLNVDFAIRKYLGVENDADLVVLLIIRVENGQVKANTRGPLIFNAATMRAVQVVLDKP
jgi:flagellar assembly factor FliW